MNFWKYLLITELVEGIHDLSWKSELIIIECRL